ncbi:MAG: dipeptidase [Candidatus Zixiibacteriota bacterium]
MDFFQIHKDSLVADLHCDTILQMNRGYDFSERHDSYHIDIPRLLEGGIDLQAFACCISLFTPEGKRFGKTDGLVKCLIREIEKHPDKIAVGRTASDAREIIASGRIAALLAIENGMAIENSLENLEYFHQLGVRYLTLTHGKSLDWCRSCSDSENDPAGLSEFGREVVKTMNRLGMIIDVSHISKASFFDVLETSSQPVIASHSNVYSISPHNRNLDDDQIRALAQNGGMMGINFWGDILSPKFTEAASPIYKKYLSELNDIDIHYSDDMDEDEYHRRFAFLKPFAAEVCAAAADVMPSATSVVDHIDYVVRLVGPDYVGLGSDFDGIYIPPSDLQDCSQIPNITRELVRRGYSENDIRKILGGNFMRVFGRVCP